MDTSTLSRLLKTPADAQQWLKSLGVRDPQRGHANLARIAARGVTLDLLAELCDQLERELPESSDPDMALNNLERYIDAARNPLAIGALFERDPKATATLLQIFSTSQYLSDLLVADSEAFDLLRMTDGQPVARDELVRELFSEVDAIQDESSVMAALRRFKRRETLRISYGDIVRGQPLATVTRQISYLAEAIVESAVRFARGRLEEKRGVPRTEDGSRARFVVLALGKLGGTELNYSSDIDLICLYDPDGRTDGERPQSNQEFFEELVRNVIKLLTEPTGLGTTYRVDLRLRPEGSQGTVATSARAALRYYDVIGRTWERQAYVKARPIAGDLELGREFLEQLTPWIYRRYLTLADITGIKSLKRRIEQQTRRKGVDMRDVKVGHGGIRDIEFVIQFLQLLNGGAAAELRSGNTLDAIALLEQNGCLTFQERSILEESYTFLRKVEHRLQILFDLQTHVLPELADERRKLAIRMGYADTGEEPALAAFDEDYRNKTQLNRKILDHLLHDAFSDDAETEPEVDLINDPDPPAERIEEVFSRYPFRDASAAHRNLMALATEKIRFLSTRRCRHFLASIAPDLLKSISATPDPDSTLVQLAQVSDSLGGKAALWELLRVNQPSVHLYVTLCAACPYLCGILTSNPGMVDELMDSLLLGALPTLDQLDHSLEELSRRAEDLDPILHSFKDALHLRVGVRDILGKDDIQATHRALAATAEACVKRIANDEYNKLLKKYGTPTIGEGPHEGQPSAMVILALGKLGGCEPNYHSDLDLVFLYEADGVTIPAERGPRRNGTTNAHFFSELGQRIIKVTSHLGPHGRLYEVDARLRPTGKSGSLAVPIDELARYFAEGAGQLWERQALCKGRIIFGPASTAQRAMQVVAQSAFGPDWKPTDAAEIRQMRLRLQENASPRNLKRGPGGTMDIEFITQMLQLKHGRKNPSVQVPGTLDALRALHGAGILSDEDYTQLSEGYRFQRSVESGIRLMNSSGRHDLPEEKMELDKLAYLLQYPDSAVLAEKCHAAFRQNRESFERIFAAN